MTNYNCAICSVLLPVGSRCCMLKEKMCCFRPCSEWPTAPEPSVALITWMSVFWTLHEMKIFLQECISVYGFLSTSRSKSGDSNHAENTFLCLNPKYSIRLKVLKHQSILLYTNTTLIQPNCLKYNKMARNYINELLKRHIYKSL